MQARRINTREAETGQQKYYAYLNAQTRNSVNKSNFTAQQQLKVDRVANMLAMLYPHAQTYTNFRKTLVSIKVSKFTTGNAKQLREYEEYLAEQGWEKKCSDQGTVYAVKKVNI